MNKTQTYFVYKTPVGNVAIASDGHAVTKLSFDILHFDTYDEKATRITNRAANELVQYMAGKLTKFQIPINPSGTKYQRKVWTTLQKQPYGKPITATKLAEKMNEPSSYRAIGQAVAKNPIPIIIPDHRLVTSTGKTKGYDSISKRKELLLRFETIQLSKRELQSTQSYYE